MRLDALPRDLIEAVLKLPLHGDRKVRIRAKGKCPKCGGKFLETILGYLCPDCQTVPRRFYLDFRFGGRRIRIFTDKDGVPLASYEQAKSLAEKIEYEIKKNIFDPSLYIRADREKFLLENLITKYLSEAEKRCKWGGFRMKKLWLRKTLDFLHSKGVSDVREITSLHLAEFFESLSHLAPKTRRNIRTEIQAFLNWCKKFRIIQELPHIPEIRVPEPEIRWIDEETQARIVESIPEEHRDIFVFILFYGCRPSEARALMWDCVFFRDELVLIKRTFSAKRLYDIPKEGRWKFLPLIEPIKSMLRRRAKDKQSEFVFWHKSRWGRVYHYGEVKLREIWKEACRKVGVEIDLYAGARHSKAMQLLRNGASYEQVGALLGHADPQTTRRYGRLKAEQIRELLERNVIPFPGLKTSTASE